MGFRVPSVLVNPAGNVAIAIIDLYGPKYLILVVDDYNQNHINSGLVGITEYSNSLKMPSYYSPSIPYICTPANPQGTNLKRSLKEIDTQSILPGEYEPGLHF